MTVPLYIQGADAPDLEITWQDSNGDLIDFSAGYTFSLKIGTPGSAAALTKTTGITGAATAPNVTVAWATSGDLNTLDIGTHTGQLKATRTSDGKERYLPFQLKVTAAIT